MSFVLDAPIDDPLDIVMAFFAARSMACATFTMLSSDKSASDSNLFCTALSLTLQINLSLNILLRASPNLLLSAMALSSAKKVAIDSTTIVKLKPLDD
uniref:Uncharacterized protein n=1 Tax=Amphimedon queenslandica TaxID=400682 RepID=A0A1X7U3C3_AMPQE